MYRNLGNSSIRKIKQDSLKANYLLDNILLLSSNSGFKVQADMKIEDREGEIISFCDIPKSAKPLLVFRFNEFTCKSCIYKELNILQYFASQIGKENIVLLGDFNSSRNLFIDLRISGLGFNVYNVSSQVLIMPLRL